MPTIPSMPTMHLLTLSRSDFRATFRDPIFRVLLFFPWLAFGLLRWGLPLATMHYPAVAPYGPVVVMWACLQSAIMFGFIYGFLFLEEKEERIGEVIGVLPVSPLRLTAARLALGLAVSTAVNWLMLRAGGVVRLAWPDELVIALQFSLAAPLIALALGALARNRVEGLGWMKIVNLLLIAPGLLFILPHPAWHVLAVVPTYWSFRALELAVERAPAYPVFLTAGFLAYAAAIYVLNRVRK